MASGNVAPVMEKIMKRARHAERHVLRRVKQADYRERMRTRMQVKEELKFASQEHRNNIKLAQKVRQEQWEMGALAPKRQIGVNGYGVLEAQAHFNPTLGGMHKPRPEVPAKRCAWAGGVKRLNLAVGDRVVVMEGVNKGKIDQIADIDTDAGTVTLQDVHKVC
jgi:large subunit ribosomal protein L24